MVATILRNIVKSILVLLPADAPAYLYTHLFKPRLLRLGVNMLLCKMIPAFIVLPEGKLALNHEDPVVSGALMLGAYEPFFAHEWRKAITPNMTIVDIGANIGYYTIIASAHVKEGRVIAYEPEPVNVSFLKQSIAFNNCTNITLIESGLGDTDESRDLYLDSDNKGKHTLLPGEQKGAVKIRIPLTTLDHSLDTLGITRVDLIKMDIEGWEVKALRGMRETLRRDHPILFFEYAPNRIRETGEDPLLIFETLRQEGYDFAVINEKTKCLEPLPRPDKLSLTLRGPDAYINIYARVASETP